jgi:tetratricopeptide (TPR) repeat protein
VVLVSPRAINAPWVHQEVQLAQAVKRAREGYKVIPLLYDGVTAGALPWLFGEEVLAVSLGNGPNAVAAAVPALLAALGLALPDEPERATPLDTAPLADLTLSLSEPAMVERDGTQRATAVAELVYQPPDGAPPLRSPRYRLSAPLGPIEAGELAWYLERYAVWPSEPFQQRAREVEEALPRWGQALYALLHDTAPRRAWQEGQARSQRRLSVLVDERLLEGAEEEAQRQARQAATQWLALPWELLHDGDGFLFQGARGVRVRRQLPGHTTGALQEELQRAYDAGTPYHVVHFDGHGVYDRTLGLGALCFEGPADAGKLTQRRARLVYADDLASVLRDYRVPLVCLEACQTAHAEDTPTASVAARLLQQGVASVVAMSHSVLVETARRFVTRFYHELLRGARIGQAMLAAQRALSQDPYRGKALQEELRLHDWFVPVLLQEEADPALLNAVPEARLRQELAAQHQAALGQLPAPTPHRFLGRSRELLAAERLLCTPTNPSPGAVSPARYVVLRGEGGEGKTTLAVELARWLMHSRRFALTAFVSLEDHRDADAVRFALGEQLVPDYVAQGGADPRTGEQLLARVLQRQAVLLVFDNMESVLPPPTDDALAPTPEAAAARFEPEVLAHILQLAQRLNALGQTRLLFTSREALPEPFARHHIVLDRLERADAITLVGQVLAEQPDLGPRAGQAEEDEQAIADLVDAVGCHARSLVLLAQEVGRAGVRTATQRLHAIMADLQRRYPNDRQRSLLASVELSLRRLPVALRQRLGPLGAFQDGGTGWAIAQVLGLDYQQDEEITLGRQLEAVGLGTLLPVGQGMAYLRFNPALAPALWGALPEAQRHTARAAWAEAMRQLVHFLYEQKDKDTHLVRHLTLLELPNLLAALTCLARAAAGATAIPTAVPDAATAAPTWEAVVAIATRLEGLLQYLGRPQALARVAEVRAQAVAHLGAWSHTRFGAECSAIERLHDARRLPEAVVAARTLWQRAKDAGATAYLGAAYHLVLAQFLLGRMLRLSGDAEAALPLLAEAHAGFTTLAQAGDTAATGMALACLTESGDCLCVLGRLEPAASAYETAIALSEQRHDARQVATNKAQLGTVRKLQGDYPAALAAWTEARETFMQLNEPVMVAVAWHQIGTVHQEAGQYEAAEQAYQASLRLETQLSDTAGQASTLHQLGSLYGAMDRPEDAVRFSLQAADLYAVKYDLAHEGLSRSNAAIGLITLQCYDAARRELQRAITCKAPFGHAAEPWKTFDILSDLERAEGNPDAAAMARQQAMDAYLAYRRAGGVSQSPRAQWYTLVAQALTTPQRTDATTQLAALAQRPGPGRRSGSALPRGRRAAPAARPDRSGLRRALADGGCHGGAPRTLSPGFVAASWPHMPPATRQTFLPEVI